jgi:hypothetical protein
MAFNPFGQSSLAQSIINGRLTNITSSTPMQPQDMNKNNVFRNPYSPTGFYANDTDVNPKPSFTPPTTDDQGNKQCDNFEGYYYDPISDSCKLIASETMNEGNDREVQEEPYQGVGSVYSPTQNAFMNLGLGGSTAEDVKSYYGSGEISKSGFGFDSFNQGLKSILGLTPLGIPLRIGRNQDIDFLVKSGIINRGSNGNLTFAKGGNLNLVKANQEFEQNLARQQGLNLDAVGANPLVYQDSLGNTFSQPYQQSRGDKANNMSNNVYNDNVTVSPFQSNYGASEIVSYSPPDPNRQKSASEKTFDRKQAEQGGQISRQSTSYKNKAR